MYSTWFHSSDSATPVYGFPVTQTPLLNAGIEGRYSALRGVYQARRRNQCLPDGESPHDMLLAAFGDVHGNLPALAAVLAAIDEEGIESLVCTGDLVVGFPWPNQVLDLLIHRGIPCVQGEMDRAAAAFLRKSKAVRHKGSHALHLALEWTYAHTRSDHIELLKSLPRRRLLTYETIDVCLCHGTPSSQSESLHEDDDEALYRRERERANVRLIVHGRTHRPCARLVDDTLFVNPGSAGMPAGVGSRASYAVIDTETEPWSAQFRWVEYDGAPVLEALRHAGLDYPAM